MHLSNTPRCATAQAAETTKRLPVVIDGSNQPSLAAEQRNAEIKRRALLKEQDLERRRRRKRRGQKPSLAQLRVCELNRLFYSRYRGYLLPDDDDGRDSVMIMINHLAMLPDARLRTKDFLGRCAPWLSTSDAENLIASAITPRLWKADTLATRLNLTDVQRSFLKIRTIGAVDCTKEQREVRRREKNRIAQKTKRRKAGAKSQAESVSRAKPWEAEKISRRSWYRRMAQLRQQYITGSVTADEPVPLPLNRSTTDIGATCRSKCLLEGPSFQPLSAALAGGDHARLTWHSGEELDADAQPV